MRIKSIAENEATGPVKAEYDRLIERFGMVPNVTRVFSLWPALFEAHNELYQRVMVDRTLLPKPIKQLIAVRASLATRCTYGIFWHSRFLALLGVNQEIIDAASGDLQQASIDAKTMTLLEFADHMARDAASVTTADVDRLREHGFSDEEILETAVVVGYFAFLTTVINAMGVEVERSQGPTVAGEDVPPTENPLSGPLH